MYASTINDQTSIAGFQAEPYSGAIQYSYGKSKYDNQPKQCSAMSWGAFYEAIDANRSKAKGEGWICPKMGLGFNNNPKKYKGEAHWRQAHLALPTPFLEIDCDGMPPEMLKPLINALNMFSGCSYTTASFTSENPRIRGVIALNRLVDYSERIRVGKAFERLLEGQCINGVKFDPSVYFSAQPCYLPLTDADFITHKGTMALNVDALLASDYSKLEDADGSKPSEAIEGLFNDLPLDEQRSLVAEIEAKRAELKEAARAANWDYKNAEVVEAQTELVRLGAGLVNCWQFSDASLKAICEELTKDYVNTLTRSQWVGVVTVAARNAPLGSSDAEAIKSCVQAWSEQHSCYAGYIPQGNEHPEFESYGGKDDPFTDFQNRWDEGEHTANVSNSPFNKLSYMANNNRPTPQLIMADGTLYDLFGSNVDLGIKFDLASGSQPQQTAIIKGIDPNARADIANAQRLVIAASGCIRWVPEHKGWLQWNGNNWQRCTLGEVEQLAKQVTMAMVQEATVLMTTDQDRGQRLMQEAIRTQAKPRLEAMVDLAKSEIGVAINASALDADTMLLGVRNGVVDLRTGALLAADPKMLITKSCNAGYDRDAKCPRWLQFLTDLFPNDPDTIETIQRALGYTLTGLNTEEKLFICVGFGSNGKSVFGNIVHRLLGDYAQTSNGSLLVARQPGDNSARGDIAALAGCRYVGINETQAGDRLDEQGVKILAGREPITARFPYGLDFTYIPQFTPWLRTNHKPRIHGTDDGIWRRLVVIPFNRKFSENERDPHLEQKLMAEQDGILAWIVEGVQKYLHQGGLKLSPTIQREGLEYRTESDFIGQFLNERTKAVTGARTEQQVIYQRWGSWCVDNGVRQQSKQSFTRRLKERGFLTIRSNSRDFYIGLELA